MIYVDIHIIAAMAEAIETMPSQWLTSVVSCILKEASQSRPWYDSLQKSSHGVV